ncbi:hypothetical protein DRE_04034 [Drechslerella stenobrocha 248]|uniref:Zn(2)-C6 fungal-type domain-containing protein n=1 Tax=Drechslerella stenobrocha 248 TaxID=1043628 RepID=W7HTN2_9PEZI|nr:hypothetical protein DRE_04034 [Drechslerella stenobrocha 248]
MPRGVKDEGTCFYCRRDKKKCLRETPKGEPLACERCAKYGYICGATQPSQAESTRRVLNRHRCDACRKHHQVCLPIDRQWPDRCDRCVKRNRACSPPFAQSAAGRALASSLYFPSLNPTVTPPSPTSQANYPALSSVSSRSATSLESSPRSRSQITDIMSIDNVLVTTPDQTRYDYRDWVQKLEGNRR